MFEDSPFFTMVYHSFNILSNCVSIFWMYIIITKSPPEMERFKWVMLKLAICEELFSFMVGVGLMLYPLLPSAAIACYGLLLAPRFFGETGAKIVAANCVFWGASILFSINNCLDYRGLVIARQDQFLDKLFEWKNMVAFLIITHGTLAIPTHAFQYYTFENVEYFIARIRSTEEFAFVEDSARRNVTILSVDYRNPYTQAGGVAAAFGFGVFFALNIWRSISVWRSLHRMEETLSKKAFYLHRRMLLLLFAQNLSPVVMIVIPSTACVIAFLTDQKQLIQTSAFQCFFTLSMLCYPFLISLITRTTRVQNTNIVIGSISGPTPRIIISPSQNNIGRVDWTRMDNTDVRRLSVNDIYHSVTL